MADGPTERSEFDPQNLYEDVNKLKNMEPYKAFYGKTSDDSAPNSNLENPFKF